MTSQSRRQNKKIYYEVIFMIITTKLYATDIKKQLKTSESILNLSDNALYRICSFIVGSLVSLPAGVAAYVFNEMLIANRNALNSILVKMEKQGKTYMNVVSTYQFIGYGTGGSSYPTYKLVSQTFTL